MKRASRPAALAVAIVAALSGIPSSVSASSAEVRRGRTSVSVEAYGNSYVAKVELNDSVRGKFVVDTGASSTIITPKIAQRLGIGEDAGAPIPVRVADGRVVEGRFLYLDEIRVGRASVYDAEVIVLEYFGNTGFDGLLGMSFLGHFTFKIDHDASKLFLYERD